jgi:hypothetical protein
MRQGGRSVAKSATTPARLSCYGASHELAPFQ